MYINCYILLYKIALKDCNYNKFKCKDIFAKRSQHYFQFPNTEEIVKFPAYTSGFITQ